LFDSLMKGMGRITLVFCMVDYSIMMVLVGWLGGGGFLLIVRGRGQLARPLA